MNHALEVLALVAAVVISGSFVPLGTIVSWLLRRRRVERLLIVGTNPPARAVIEEIERQPNVRTIVGVVNGGTENLGRAIETTRPNRIVVALAERRGHLPLSRLVESLARGIVVEDVTETYERLTGKLALEVLSAGSVIFSRDFRTSRLQRTLSRALSLLVSLIGLIVLAPVLGLIALLIRLDSRGPVFFLQERVGLFGRAFTLIKFCTMRPARRPNSEWEQDNRDRITRIGRWLRRFRLDELPQLANVLRGDMNLVGPRPHPVTNLEVLILAARNLNEISGDAIPYYSLRCSVRPGMTGWAQVRYHYANSLEEEMEKIRFDLYYIKHHSLWLDLRILFETLKTVLRGRSGTSGTAPAARPLEEHGRAPVLWEHREWDQVDEYAAALAAVRGSGSLQGSGPELEPTVGVLDIR
ncbi:MAG TPA: sugar transferase [Candidatus Dormibacteraeota bacterium]|nr:sugar transferase [Candidatus Dormibacteraeota bacterium]